MTLTSPTYYQHPTLGNLSDYVQHMPYFQGAAFKYVARAGKKPGVPASDDLAKAKECLRIQTGDGSNPTVVIPENLRKRLWKHLIELSPSGSGVVERNRTSILHNIAEGNFDSVTPAHIEHLEELLEKEKTE